MDILKSKHLRTAGALAGVVAIAVPAATAGATSSAGLTSFHGTVVSTSSSAKTLKIKRPTGTTLTFRVTSSTTFERLGGGLGALRAGRSIEVKARRVDGRWTARKVEPATAEHEQGDDHGRGDDDRGGDDHGSGGHGSDD